MIRYGFKFVVVALAALLLGVIGIIVFTDVWARVGLITAIVVVCSPLIIYAWFYDRRERERRQGLRDI